MKTRSSIIIISLVCTLGLSSCVLTPVKQASVLTPIDVPTGKDARPIQFKRIVVKLKRGEQIGEYAGGLACIKHGPLNWKGGRLTLSGDEFTEAFRDELLKANYPVVGNPDALFDDPSEWKAELLVAGLVKSMEANICYPYSGFGDFNRSQGGAYLKVDWQVFSRLDRKVIYEVSTEGSYQADKAASGGSGVLLVNAFAIATQNLLADRNFHELVVRTERAAPVISSDPNIKLSNKTTLSRLPVKSDANRSRQGVVTVFAGSGHGSGFFVGGDGYVLTNEHVVRQAKYVKVQLATGREVLGEVIRTDAFRDVALVRVEEKGISPLPLSISELSIGSDVYAVGTPLDKKLTTTLTKGIVSAYRNEDGKKFIQSDVQILPGNSGGPLLDEFGNVVGIAVSALIFRGAPTGLNFFIPIGDALSTLSLEM